LAALKFALSFTFCMSSWWHFLKMPFSRSVFIILIIAFLIISYGEARHKRKKHNSRRHRFKKSASQICYQVCKDITRTAKNLNPCKQSKRKAMCRYCYIQFKCNSASMFFDHFFKGPYGGLRKRLYRKSLSKNPKKQ